MPIKNFIDGEVQYLVQYEPYGIPTGQVEPTNVAEMVSLDIQSTETPTVINYSIGATSNYTAVINIKNITNNATLDIIVTLPPQVFTSTQAIILPTVANFPQRQVINLTLAPQQQQQVQISLNKNFLDTQSNYAKFETTVPISIRSRTNNSIITKNINVSTLQQTKLPTTINVV